MNISDLSHVSVGNSKSGPFVLVLSDGAVITAEDRAMLQSLYSRSPSSVVTHLKKLAETGSGKFMEQFYIGYGHKSIGDCGYTTIFIENVSMFVAKAIQDTMLYDGQEVSTRYLDFAKQPSVNPLNFSSDSNPQEKLRAFYIKAMPILEDDLRIRYPRKEDEKESFYEKAIAVRAFDILRGFLPSGAETNVAWTTNLRQASDRLKILRLHILPEVRKVAEMILEALKKAYPHSFNHKEYEATDIYVERYMEKVYYFNPGYMRDSVVMKKNSLDRELIRYYLEEILTRPEKTELPKHLGEIGTLQFEFTLDFGSFRDIARHRALIQRMPLVTPEYGFHGWYLEQLPVSLREEVLLIILFLDTWWNSLNSSTEDEEFKAMLQYYLPMGYRVACRITGDLPSLLYLVELRSGVMVHATLREVAQDIGKIIENLGIPVYIDRSEIGRFDIKRGAQDIVMK